MTNTTSEVLSLDNDRIYEWLRNGFRMRNGRLAGESIEEIPPGKTQTIYVRFNDQMSL